MATLNRWCNNIEPATALVPCGEQQHRVTWRRGKLVLEDHDLGAERAMLALGGKPCACLQVLKMWRDQWAMPPDLFRQMSTWLGPNAFLAPPELATPRQLALALNWNRSWRRSSYTTKLGRLLEEDVRSLAAQPVRRHVTALAKQFGLWNAPSTTVELARGQQPATLVGQVDKRGASATARLNLDWLLRVWGPGAAVVGDGFVLEVIDDQAQDGSMVVRAARWLEDAGTSGLRATDARARLSRAEAGWALTWIEGG
ncbi:MAG: hypothetical protein M3083_06480 [Actinomycetota bacterium]|nr:hypothetical protein [Actinomycetota bacterium]